LSIVLVVHPVFKLLSDRSLEFLATLNDFPDDIAVAGVLSLLDAISGISQISSQSTVYLGFAATDVGNDVLFDSIKFEDDFFSALEEQELKQNFSVLHLFGFQLLFLSFFIVSE